MIEPGDGSAAIVLCMSADHPTKTAVVAFLFRREDGSWWARSDDYADATSYLDERDSKLTVLKSSLYRRYPNRRETDTIRHHFETSPCPRCGDKLSCRGERLDPLLDELWLCGVEAGLAHMRGAAIAVPIPLGLLAAKLGSR